MPESYTGRKRPRKKSSGGRKNIDSLLNALANGGSEAVLALQQNLSAHRERGNQSIQQVIEALAQLDKVVTITRVDHDRDIDKRGIDLVITLDDSTKIWVQVKSSRRGVTSFALRQKQGRYNKSIIVIDGQRSAEQIQRSFLDQISRKSRQ